VRNGTTSLLAALDVASGKVISATHRRHRHQEFLKFLRTIDHSVPSGLDAHLICNNYQTHKTWIQAWNDDPKPFVWTKTADEILENLAGYRQRINNSGH
jgi:hypothetical protein